MPPPLRVGGIKTREVTTFLIPTSPTGGYTNFGVWVAYDRASPSAWGIAFTTLTSYTTRHTGRTVNVRVFSDCWTMMNNMHGFGANPVRGITTVSACQAACVSNASCAGIDYDHNNAEGNYCWLLSNGRRSVAIVRAPGVTHYVLDRNCITGKSQMNHSSCLFR